MQLLEKGFQMEAGWASGLDPAAVTPELRQFVEAGGYSRPGSSAKKEIVQTLELLYNDPVRNFYKGAVSRRLVAQAAERQDRGPSLPQPLKIILDETVIPQKYSRVLVRALYVDSIDFDLVDDKTVEISDRVKDAMELYQIGRFLDLDILAQNCEDAIVQRLNQVT